MSNLFWAAFYLLIFLRLLLYWKSARDENAVEMEIAALTGVLDQVIYQRDRARMNGEASAHLAEYRMRRILELERELGSLKEDRNAVGR
jgi:hypothetical protein